MFATCWSPFSQPWWNQLNHMRQDMEQFDALVTRLAAAGVGASRISTCQPVGGCGQRSA